LDGKGMLELFSLFKYSLYNLELYTTSSVYFSCSRLDIPFTKDLFGNLNTFCNTSIDFLSLSPESILCDTSFNIFIYLLYSSIFASCVP